MGLWMEQRRITAMIGATVSVVAWGASFVATKIALRYIAPTTLVWLRFSLGVLILGAAAAARSQFSLPAKKDLAYFSSLGFLGIALHQWLQSTGLVTAEAATSSWLVSTAPVFMAILGWLFLREKLNAGQILGIVLAAVGVALIVTHGKLATLLGGNLGETGNILMLISAVNWAVFSAYSRRGLKTHPATQMMFFVMAFGWLLLSVPFFLTRGYTDIPNLAGEGWLAVLFLGIFCSGLAYIFWYDALKILPVAHTGAFLYIEPLVTVIFAALILAEPLLPSVLGGGACILMGVWLVNRRV